MGGGQVMAVGRGVLIPAFGAQSGVPRRRTRWRPPAGLVASIVGSLTIVVALEASALVLIDRAAENSGVAAAADTTAEVVGTALAPFLSDEALTSDSSARSALDRAGGALLAHRSLEHLKIWSEDGKVLWADETELIGRRFELEPQDLALIETKGVAAGVSDLEQPENAAERAGGAGRMLEVYFATETTEGTPILVESYSSYDQVAERVSELRRRFIPLMSIVLAAVTVSQVGLVWMLGRRLARSEVRRAQTLERAIRASDHERRQVAAEVHDGVVQDLMGISFALAGVANDSSSHQHELRGLAGMTRSAIDSLRGLLTSIYPVTVPPEGWVAGLGDVLDVLDEHGVSVRFDVEDVELSPIDEMLVLRIAREALRNVVKHAEARSVEVRLRRHDHLIRLSIADDGQGFEAGSRNDGHFGLRLLDDFVTDAGGRLTVASGPAGTTLDLDLAASS